SATVWRRLDLRGWASGRRGATRLSRPRPLGQPGQGREGGDRPADLRAAALSEEPLSGSGADDARRVEARGLAPERAAHAGARRLDAAKRTRPGTVNGRAAL